ncbi:MAG TPA: hypothetical protein VIR16_09025 [Candidatus Limnocylindrales bacterium]
MAVVPPSTGGGGGTGAGTTSGPRTPSGTVTIDRTPAPRSNGQPVGLLDAIVQFAARESSLVVRPEVAAQVVVGLGFPLALAVLVVLFLLVQPRLDARDPKLRAAPLTLADTLIAFEEEVP